MLQRLILFQSSPEPRPRCNGETQFAGLFVTVSILTGAETPVQQKRSNKEDEELPVSILTGAETPVQPGKQVGRANLTVWFQSSPEPRPRCNANLCTAILA